MSALFPLHITMKCPVQDLAHKDPTQVQVHRVAALSMGALPTRSSSLLLLLLSETMPYVKYHRLGANEQQRLISQVLEVGSPRLRCQ